MSPPRGARSSGAFYGRFAPRPELSWAVDDIWVQTHPPAPDAPPTTVLPTGRAKLVVRFGDPFEHLTAGRAVTLPAVAVLGQRTRPLLARATGATGLVIVCLHPWATAALLGEDGRALTDGFVSLEDVAGRAIAERLVSRVAEASDTRRRVDAVHAHLVELLRRTCDPLAVEAVSRSSRSWGSASVEGLSRDLGVSRRTLARRVLRATGLPPKQLLKLSRVQKAVGALRSGASWSEVVARCSYYDQSHLIHEMKTYTGSTPGRFAPTAPSSPLAASFNTPDLSRFSNTVYL